MISESLDEVRAYSEILLATKFMSAWRNVKTQVASILRGCKLTIVGPHGCRFKSCRAQHFNYMKTPAEWRKHFKVWAEEWASDKEVKEIQLDAFKAGAEWAANQIDADRGILTSYILEATENLKELPK